MDFCENLNHHTQKSRSSDLCETCHDLLFKNKFPEDIKKYIFESLEKVRQHILRRFIGRVDLVSIKFKEVDGTKQFIVPEFNNLILKLDPQWKVLYYFFLQHPEGIGNKDVVNYRNELYKIYKELSVRDTEEENNDGELKEFEIESINRLVAFDQGEIYTGKNNLSGAITSVNAVLKTVFNEHIIDDYLIKNKKGKYTITLNRDLFVDEIVIKK
jgi:hypothetical protein